ncbi:MAG: aromatic acid exporter family protein [Enterococcus sp.]
MSIPTHWNSISKLFYGIKIGFGSAVAIFIAEQLQLEFATSAGIITLLTITNTRSESFKLCLNRLVSFFETVAFCLIVFQFVPKDWHAYGIIVALIAFTASMKRNITTVSINAVFASHFLLLQEITVPILLNEVLLLLIGMGIALVLNHVHDYKNQRERLESYIEQTEANFQIILTKLSNYMAGEADADVWEDIQTLERTLNSFHLLSFQYEQNRLPQRGEYYTKYFEMRKQQCGILQNLHYEMDKIREFHSESEIIADYLEYIKGYFDESTHPSEQLACLSALVTSISYEPSKESDSEFFCKARLYHILMNIEEFLLFKKRFIETVAKNVKR